MMIFLILFFGQASICQACGGSKLKSLENPGQVIFFFQKSAKIDEFSHFRSVKIIYIFSFFMKNRMEQH